MSSSMFWFHVCPPLHVSQLSKLAPSSPGFPPLAPPLCLRLRCPPSHPLGLPAAEVFTLKPLEFGKPNTLVCFISNLFPPTLTVTWQLHSVPVEGASPTSISAVDGLSFQAFSYLNFTPDPFDLYSCTVTHEIDRYTAIAYWGEALFCGSPVLRGAKRPRPVEGQARGRGRPMGGAGLWEGPSHFPWAP